MKLLIVAAVGILLNVLASTTFAASLRVAPVVLDLKAPTAASTIRIWNDESRPINVQVRIFRWSQRNGEDFYEATNDVVASPPITTLQPGGENLIRIVRTTKRPVQAEESYRIVVDELPDPSRRKSGTVVLVVRHSIPVFFSRTDAAGANPSWSVRPLRGGYQVTVRNGGAQRLKVSNLALSDNGRVVGKKDGLVGYVLGNATASWIVPGTGAGRPSGGSLTISADSEAGRFDATARIGGG
ncbi:fimbrial chaperone protein [Mesorhizobium sp. J18]|uniref:fimbrial biogenesis chaperone n=1 Tax=Mesorhizobium sp. J18 TaxID=935263 RepID=UPI00119B6B4D|nr:molecular chaperone [Mesorhizobium sp. J18]TWG94945.1 fimbrial chaperone protein [Mesorhizobium sp. J18]